MAKRRKQQHEPRPALERPAARPGWPSAILIAFLAAIVAASATYILAAQPQPLGTPIPRPPQPIFNLTKQAGESSSFIQRKLPKGWLLRMAPQPDGLPYLYNAYISEKLQFAIRYPYGAENVQYSLEQYSQDAVESQAIIRIDQPIAAIKVTAPVKAGDIALLQFASELLENALEQGGELRGKPEQVQLGGGGFITLAYYRETETGNFVHRLYLAAIGKRMLIFDFMLRPDHTELGDRYARKIMDTFVPGPLLEPLMELGPADAEAESAAPANEGEAAR